MEGSLPALYSSGDKVTSRLDLRDNRKVITDYRNLGIICILTDLIVSSGYLPGVLPEAPSRVVPARLRLVGWAAPGGAAHVVCRGYPGSYPPHAARTSSPPPKFPGCVLSFDPTPLALLLISFLLLWSCCGHRSSFFCFVMWFLFLFKNIVVETQFGM